jgi:hypothetical protein
MPESEAPSSLPGVRILLICDDASCSGSRGYHNHRRNATSAQRDHRDLFLIMHCYQKVLEAELKEVFMPYFESTSSA